MTSEAALFADCAANPDDDGPRLVWADHVGGERGELVVIQCDLARGGLSPAEARARRIRERELLDRHAIEWAGSLVRVATRWSFRRGFVEAARFKTWTSPVEWPLLRSVTVDHCMPGTWDGIEQLRALGVMYASSALPLVENLRALAVHRLDERYLANVLDLVATSPITTLRVRLAMTSALSIMRVLEASDRVTALELAPDLGLAFARPLRALQLGPNLIRMLAALEGRPAVATLERFGFDLLGPAVDLDRILASLQRVHTISIGGGVEAAARAVIDAGMPALRVVQIRGVVSPTTLRALDERYPDLELVDVTAIDEELVHDSAMLELGTPYLQWSLPAVFARFDRPEVIDIPAFDASDSIILGRSSGNPIRLMVSSVARRHARLHWRDGAHEIEDLRSTNGVAIAGARVERARLAEGDDLVLGEVRLRYFIGEGARDRAVAAISGLPTP